MIKISVKNKSTGNVSEILIPDSFEIKIENITQDDAEPNKMIINNITQN